MAIKKAEMNIKTEAGYDQLYPATDASIVKYDGAKIGATATNAQDAIDEISTTTDNKIDETGWKEYPLILNKDNWTGSVPPYQQTVAVTGVGKIGDVVAGFGKIDQTKLGAVRYADIWCSEIKGTSLRFSAFANKPIVDIPVVVQISRTGNSNIINTFSTGEEPKKVRKHVEITKSGNWTVPAGVTEIGVLCVGGGGGRGTDYYDFSAGGGSGYFAWREHIAVVPSASFRVTIGGGGAVGQAGGITSFGSLVSANGGKPGNTTTGGEGGAGGGGARGGYGGNGQFGGAGGGPGANKEGTVGNGGIYGGGAGCVSKSSISGKGGIYGGNGGANGVNVNVLHKMNPYMTGNGCAGNGVYADAIALGGGGGYGGCGGEGSAYKTEDRVGGAGGGYGADGGVPSLAPYTSRDYAYNGGGGGGLGHKGGNAAGKEGGGGGGYGPNGYGRGQGGEYVTALSGVVVVWWYEEA